MELERPNIREDQVTKNVEQYTAGIPLSAYLGVAVGAMVLSLVCQISGRGKWGNFIAQWVPTWLILGMYNELVKQQGHDQGNRGDFERSDFDRSPVIVDANERPLT